MEKSHSQIRRHFQGPTLILTSALFFSIMQLCTRMGRQTFRADTLMFTRLILQTLILIPWVMNYFAPHPTYSLSSRLRSHFWRGFFGVGSMWFLFLALKYLPLAMATLLTMTSIFWGSLFAWVFLKETPSRGQILWALVAIGGVTLGLLGEGMSGWHYSMRGIVYALACGVFMGLALATLRGLRRDFGSREIVFFFGLVGIVCTLPGFILEPEWPKTFSEAGVLLALGISGTIGQLLMTAGFKHTTTLIATVCNIQQTPINILVGFFVLGEVPPLNFYIGVALALFGITRLVYGEKKARV